MKGGPLLEKEVVIGFEFLLSRRPTKEVYDCQTYKQNKNDNEPMFHFGILSIVGKD
jgi:hypothetical protein